MTVADIASDDSDFNQASYENGEWERIVDKMKSDKIMSSYRPESLCMGAPDEDDATDCFRKYDTY